MTSWLVKSLKHAALDKSEGAAMTDVREVRLSEAPAPGMRPEEHPAGRSRHWVVLLM
jgi:hypothetical protein